ncbi:MAG: hypothetical protein IJZ74_11100, partial [Clostridia bacterium]|nr:hypothetical protein [Clostridia bacterium]
TYLDCRCEGQCDVKQIIAAYALFEDVTEKLLGQLSAMMVTAEYEDDAFQLRIQAGCREALSAPPAFMLNGRKIQCESQDEDLIIDAMIEKGGAQA